MEHKPDHSFNSFRGARQRRRLSDALRLTSVEREQLERWQCADAHDAVRLLLTHLFQAEQIPIVVRRPILSRGSASLVEVLLKSGPEAVLKIIAEERTVLVHTLRK